MGCVGAIVLAAGASSRLGRAKQTVNLGGLTLLDRAVAVAAEAGCRPVIAVLGARAEEVRAGCNLDGVRVVLNDDWAEGMASSVRAGVAALPADVAGVVILACDQPAADANHLRALVAADGCTMASGYGGRRGVPAYFPRETFADLLRLEGDQGARTLLDGAGVVALRFGELDVDTDESLEAVRRQFGEETGPG